MAEDTPVDELFGEELKKNLYNAENPLIKAALPRMARAPAPGLKRPFEHHLSETLSQAQRLGRDGRSLAIGRRGKACKGRQGLSTEGKEILRESRDPSALDAGPIGAAQEVEHYEIVAHGTARTHAQTLGPSRIAALLPQKLTAIAERLGNPQALHA